MRTEDLEKRGMGASKKYALTVTFESNLKFEKHISTIVNKVQRVLSLIHHSFDYMDQDMFLTLYKSIVRPLLEYATCVWSPHLKKDIRKLESVQRRATKLVKNINHLSYEDRLRSLGLPTLEYRRDRNDMIQCFLSAFKPGVPTTFF